MEAPEIWFPHLGIEIQKLSNVMFSIFGLDIYWYGAIIGSGVLLSLFLALHEAKRSGQNPDSYLDFTLIAMAFCVIGARLYYVIFNWQSYAANPIDIFNLRKGGLAIYGGVLAGILAAVIYTRKKKMNFWLFADTAAPSLLLGQVIGRWGNFFNREAFGGYTDSLFAMRYLKNQVRPGDMTQDILDHVVSFYGTEYIQVHPTFLYESFWNLCVFAILFYLQRKKKFDGEVFILYLFGYGLGRLWIEGLRTDQLMLGSTGLAVSQVLSVILVLVSIFLAFYRSKKQQKQ